MKATQYQKQLQTHAISQEETHLNLSTKKSELNVMI
jgi:hypothetical protein